VTATANILFDLLVVFAAAKFLGEVFERLHLPAVVGEILGGMLVGPSALNIVQQSPAFLTLATLGVIVLRFAVGLETKPRDIFKVGVTAFAVALAGVVVSFAAGFGVAAAMQLPMLARLFMGTALVSTSVGVTARVLKDRNLLQTVEARIVLAAAVVDDVLGLFVLSIVVGSAGGHLDVIRVLVVGGEILLFIAFELWFAPILIKRHEHLLGHLRIPNASFVVAIVTMLLMAAISEQLGLAAVVGASLAGMMLAETEDCGVLARDMRPLYDWLVPYFFALAGLQVQLSLFAQPRVLALGIVLALVAIAAKAFGCAAGAFGRSWIERLRIGVAMIPQAEVALIVAASGLALKVFDAGTYAAIIFAVMATMLVSPALLGFVLPRTPRATAA